MKKLMGSILFVCLAMGSLMAQTPTLEEAKDAMTPEKIGVAIGEGVTAQSVFDHYFEAIGGIEAVQAVKTIIYTAEADMGGMIVGYETKNTTKNQFALAITVGGNAMQEVKYNGNAGYIVAQGQRTDFDEAQNNDAKMKAQPFMELVVANATLERLEQLDGKDTYVIAYGDSGMEAYFDKMSGLKVKETNKEEQMGQMIETTTLYSEYKEVSGVKIPHSVTQSMGPREITFLVKQIMINEGVSDADFD